MLRENDRRQIVRAERLDDRPCDGPRLADTPQHAVRAQASIVDRDDDDAFAEPIVGRDVRRSVRHPHRWRRRRRRDVHGREGGDRPRPSIFEDCEIRLSQSPDRVAVLGEHRDVDLDELDPSPECRLRRSGTLRARTRRRRAQQGNKSEAGGAGHRGTQGNRPCRSTRLQGRRGALQCPDGAPRRTHRRPARSPAESDPQHDARRGAAPGCSAAIPRTSGRSTAPSR